MDANRSIGELAAELYERMNGSGETCAVAESCTGGAISDAITDVAGCSSYFLLGVVAYANEAKTNLLGVSKNTLARWGAVSEQTAIEMAAGVARSLGATYAVSTTGIAGPSGGTADKPVGLVYIGVYGPSGVRAERYEFDGDRRHVKDQASRAALEALVNVIKNS